MCIIVVLVCALIFATSVEAQDAQAQERVVSIPQGQIRGFRPSNNDVFQFFNVPYATAPTGRDRFKAPLAPPTWSGVMDAVDRRIVCPQTNITSFSMFMNIQEDCLVANIHVPVTNETNLPVMVIVHGGAFLNGRGTSFRPNGFVSSKNIIVVTFNYRLGPHGFLCLGTEHAPGNAGMKDQVALLHWVKDNIGRFGGNPDEVTITGCSAGGSSVDLLLLSSMSNGLFNKVISESGCSSTIFAVQQNPTQNAMKYAQDIGFTNAADLDDLTKFYLTAPILDLFKGGLSLVDAKDAYFVFQPCVEKDIGQARFLEDAPTNILKSGNYRRLPAIFGFAEMEGLFNLRHFETWSIEMNKNFSDFLPADLQFTSKAQKEELASLLKQFYFGNYTIGEKTILEYFHYFTDAYFASGIVRNVKERAKTGHTDTYLYKYSFTDNESTSIPHTDGLRGADHCDQMIVIMDPASPETLSEERKQMSETLRDIMYNFIITGNPTPPGSVSMLPTWPAADVNGSQYLLVGHTIEARDDAVTAQLALWNDIYRQYQAIPKPPEGIIEDVTTTLPELSTAETDPDIEIATPVPDSASVKSLFSIRLWILYTIVFFVIPK